MVLIAGFPIFTFEKLIVVPPLQQRVDPSCPLWTVFVSSLLDTMAAPPATTSVLKADPKDGKELAKKKFGVDLWVGGLLPIWCVHSFTARSLAAGSLRPSVRAHHPRPSRHEDHQIVHGGTALESRALGGIVLTRLVLCVQTRASLEESYGKQLEKLEKVGVMQEDTSLSQCFKDVKDGAGGVAKQHIQFGVVSAQYVQPLLGASRARSAASLTACCSPPRAELRQF
jgi:hypothetical protein